MPKETTLSVALRNARCTTLATRLSGGVLRLYTGPKPASPDTAITTQTLLSEHALGAPAFNAPASGVMTSTAIGSGTGLADGDAAWFRAFQSDGTTAEQDGTVGVGSGYNMLLNAVHVVPGIAVDITGWTHTEPMTVTT